MGEYIDREALLKRANEVSCGSFATGLILSAILNAPTANVVEVVRCKDCCYANENGDVCRYGVGRYTKPDKYCSDGERREDK